MTLDRGELRKRAGAARSRLLAVEIEAATDLLARAERASDSKQRVAAIREARATVAFASRLVPSVADSQADALVTRLAELQARVEELAALHLRSPLPLVSPGGVSGSYTNNRNSGVTPSAYYPARKRRQS
jgi:hypothetical protein